MFEIFQDIGLLREHRALLTEFWALLTEYRDLLSVVDVLGRLNDCKDNFSSVKYLRI